MALRFRRVLSLLAAACVPVLAAGCGTAISVGSQGSLAGGPRAAAGALMSGPAIGVESVELGTVAPGANTFTARVANRTRAPLAIVLDLRATPGMWTGPAWQKQFTFTIPPGPAEAIQAAYELAHVTPEATLRVRIGSAIGAPDGGTRLGELLFERTYSVGRQNAAGAAFLARFDTHATEHLDLFALRGSLAASRLTRIGAERERAAAELSRLLAVTPSERLRVVFYPDAASKRADTGHTGAGLARGNTLVEIYSDEVQLDPYHELAHVLARHVGDPPAVLNEGFATYVSERLGGDGLKQLGHPGVKIDQAARDLAASGRLVPLADLIRYTEIGSEESRPAAAYPQAASLVAFLVETHGLSRFRRAYAALVNGDEPDRVRRNEEAWQRVFGASVEQTDAAWRRHLDTVPPER